MALLSLCDDESYSFELERKLNTKSGNNNWLINVDEKSMKFIDNKRLCINFERYRLVKYIPIIRCYGCQQFGHTKSKCTNPIVCPKCAEEHTENECKSNVTKCNNCYFDEGNLILAIDQTAESVSITKHIDRI